MKPIIESELLTLVRMVEKGIFPPAKWNHHAHVLLCLYYCSRSDNQFEAITYTRCALIRFNAATKKSCVDSYHETMTQFYVRQVYDFVQKHRSLCLDELLNILDDQPFMDKSYPILFYSVEVLKSPEARATYVDPLFPNGDRRG